MVKIIVKDTGIGINKKDLENIKKITENVKRYEKNLF